MFAHGLPLFTASLPSLQRSKALNWKPTKRAKPRMMIGMTRSMMPLVVKVRFICIILKYIYSTNSLDDPGSSLAARLRTKLQQRGVVDPNDVRDDFLDEDSASSSMDEFDMEENLRKDHLQEVQAQMVRELSSLTLGVVPESAAQLETCRRLAGLLREYPTQRSALLKSQGVMPLFELLELAQQGSVLDAALEVVLAALDGQKAVQESLLVLGAVPVLVAFWENRDDARHTSSTLHLTVQIFRSLARSVLFVSLPF